MTTLNYCVCCCEAEADPDLADPDWCADCYAWMAYPSFICRIPGHLPTFGGKAGECTDCWDNPKNVELRRQERNAPRVAELKAILVNFMREDRIRKWEFMEYAKASFGNMLLKAIHELGGEVLMDELLFFSPPSRLLSTPRRPTQGD